MYLADHTWPELGEALSDESVALVPLGSTEQHGPPAAGDRPSDRRGARERGRRGDGRRPHPTVTVGVSPHHRQFPGTMWVDPPEFRDYVEGFTRNRVSRDRPRRVRERPRR